MDLYLTIPYERVLVEIKHVKKNEGLGHLLASWMHLPARLRNLPASCRHLPARPEGFAWSSDLHAWGPGIVHQESYNIPVDPRQSNSLLERGEYKTTRPQPCHNTIPEV